MAGALARLVDAPARLWRGRFWWIYALLAFAAVPALTAVLIKTPPIMPAFAYTLR
jgi:hypothetical protein